MTNEIETEFLVESNAIERVYDDDSLSQAILAWEFLKLQDKLSIGVILKTHKILMLNQNLKPDEKGYFRKRPVYIGYKEMMKPSQIEDAIKQWILNVNDAIRNGKNESEIWKERICKEHHIQFEKCHPVIDANGRLGRIIMNWERLKLGLPILVIHEGKEQYEYYQWFHE